MLITFDEIIEIVLHHEGGYVNDPDDPGGENAGSSKLWLVEDSGSKYLVLPSS